MKTDNPVNIWKEMIHEYSLMNSTLIMNKHTRAIPNVIFRNPEEHIQI